MKKLYKILKNYESPNRKIYKGVMKNEDEWLEIFPHLNKKDLQIKTDWFEEIDKKAEYSKINMVEFGMFLLSKNNITLFRSILHCPKEEIRDHIEREFERFLNENDTN
jgi:hypothetical protein